MFRFVPYVESAEVGVSSEEAEEVRGVSRHLKF